MSFRSGRASFCLFAVDGDAPKTVEPKLLEQLQARAFRSETIGIPAEILTSWITGEHLFDNDFTYEKNGFGDILLCAMRIDTYKAPADIRRAYKQMHEQTMAAGNPSGFASKNQKQEATETADAKIRDELAAGKHHRAKSVPVMWDLRHRMLYCGTLSVTAIEQLEKLFSQTFGLRLERLGSSGMAGQILRGKGHGRDYEDLKPSAFTPPPPMAPSDDEEEGPGRNINVPTVPWVKAAVDTKDFVGNEFLFWLWWTTEIHSGVVTAVSDTVRAEVSVAFDKTLDMDCAWGQGGTQSLRGDGPTRWPEAGRGMAAGKWPRKASLIMADSDNQWELTFHADRFSVGAALLPAAEDVSHVREMIEYRLQSIRSLALTLNGLFATFLQQRVGSRWPSVRNQIAKWISQRKGVRATAGKQSTTVSA